MDKIEAMRTFKSYNFKKVFLEDKVFVRDYKELKLGYLNVNDLTAEFHAEYLNSDKNLVHLDVLVVADSRLTSQYNVQQLEDKLDNYTLFSRYDSDDDVKHMGLVALCSRTSNLIDELPNIETNCFRLKEKMINGLMETYIQGLIMKFKKYEVNVAFVYIRRKPKKEDILIH